MKALTLLAVIAVTPAWSAENVYRNGPADQATSSFFRLAGVAGGVSQEWGDEIKLAGVGRTITEMSVYTFGDFAIPTGSEAIRIRLYAPDGPPVGAPPESAPGTVLWDSGPVPMKAGWRAQRITVPSIVVPDQFIWTASFEGTTGAPFNRAGLCYFGPPTIGLSDAKVWRRSDDVSPWSYQTTNWTNGATAYGSFGAVFWADGPPAPVIFDSTTAPDRAYRVTPEAEIGDDAVFEGEARFLSDAVIEYVSEVNSPQGDERARVRIYDRDPLSPFGEPSALLFDSGRQPIDATLGGHFFTVYPEILVPDDVIWTIEFSGVTQLSGDALTIPARTDPNPGSSVPTFWFRDAGVMSAFWFGDPTYDPTTWPSTKEGFNNIIGNFSAKFVANIPPIIVEHVDPPTLAPGAIFSGTNLDLLASDNVYWTLLPGIVFNPAAPPIVVIFDHILADPTASSLRVTVESRASAPISQEIAIWDHTGPGWTVIEVLPSVPLGGQPDLSRTLDVGLAAPYIGPSNEVRIRLRYRLNGPSASFPWRVSLDREYISYRP